MGILRRVPKGPPASLISVEKSTESRGKSACRSVARSL
jgi:hypothetical protein